MRSNNRGSALLSALILGSILLLTLSALIATALSELRGATRYTLNSVAFSLAEASIDRTSIYIYGTNSGDSLTSSGVWTVNSSTYTRTYAADKASLNNVTGSCKVIVEKASTSGSTDVTYTVYARATVTNAAGITAQRAIKTVFTRSTTSSTGTGYGCIAKTAFSAGTGSTDPTQPRPTFDSYTSTGNTAPDSSTNRNSNCMVGTSSSINNALDLKNGEYYCHVGTGSSDSNPTPTVLTTDSSKGTGSLVTMLDLVDDDSSDDTTLVQYSSSLVERDVETSTTSLIPPTTTSAWTVTTSSSVASTITLTDKTYLVLSDSNNVTNNISNNGLTLNVSGTAVLVIPSCSKLLLSKIKIAFKTADANLSIYVNGSVVSESGSSLTCTTLYSQSGTALSSESTNWESSRLALYVLPSFTYSSGDTPATIASNVTTALSASSISASTVSFNGFKTFVGSIYAPYSTASFDSPNSASSFCGTLWCNSLSVTGSNYFHFHYDEQLNSSSSTSPSVTVSSWQQIMASDSVFN